MSLSDISFADVFWFMSYAISSAFLIVGAFASIFFIGAYIVDEIDYRRKLKRDKK